MAVREFSYQDAGAWLLRKAKHEQRSGQFFPERYQHVGYARAEGQTLCVVGRSMGADQEFIAWARGHSRGKGHRIVSNDVNLTQTNDWHVTHLPGQARTGRGVWSHWRDGWKSRC